mmetsp:Transcript_1225/g.2716  ORF Transcript_1225/g.2716 Transcript_1225/m.2716 type:complete len:246 (-) Transcript_1225:386-1123(-)
MIPGFAIEENTFLTSTLWITRPPWLWPPATSSLLGSSLSASTPMIAIGWTTANVPKFLPSSRVLANKLVFQNASDCISTMSIPNIISIAEPDCFPPSATPLPSSPFLMSRARKDTAGGAEAERTYTSLPNPKADLALEPNDLLTRRMMPVSTILVPTADAIAFSDTLRSCIRQSTALCSEKAFEYVFKPLRLVLRAIPDRGWKKRRWAYSFKSLSDWSKSSARTDAMDNCLNFSVGSILSDASCL